MQIKNIMLALLIAAAYAAASAGVVSAQEDGDVVAEQFQECRQEVEQECEAGAYGQIVSCKQKAEQVCEQRQKIVVKDRVLGVVHEPADTALDLQTTLAAAGILAGGAGSFALKRKLG